jgi:hypothetical protein
MYQLLQRITLNYRDFMLARFNRGLADAVTWQLLPFGATAPSDAEGPVVERKVDPAQTHPYCQTDLPNRIDKKRNGRSITTHDHTVITWQQVLRDNGRYAWKHGNGSWPPLSYRRPSGSR